MSHYPHPIIAREGWPFLIASLGAALGVAGLVGWGWSTPLWVLGVFILQFFRDPARVVPTAPRLVLAPADGRIVCVERAHDPYLDREAQKLSVFMNVFNVHSNRSPVGGTVARVWYHPGKYFNAALSKASTENERNALWIKTDDGADVTCVQVAGLIARRILCYARQDQRLARGQRYGFIRFGSRVDVYVPLSARITASLGDHARAGETVLAEL
ncbi:MAG: phosphatidylserine decarboxylase [Burkholderiales bacterium]